MTQPLRTQTTRHETALLTPFVAELRGGGSDVRKVTDPAATFCASGNHHALVTPYYGTCAEARPVDRPVGTLTTVDRYALIHRHNTGGAEMTTPVNEYLRTLTTPGHQSLIQQPETPSRRPVTAADRAAAAELVDECFLRMFMPSEVAAGMAFPRTYRWDVLNEHGRTPSNRDLVRMGGNAVCPLCSRDIMGVIAEAYAP